MDWEICQIPLSGCDGVKVFPITVLMNSKYFLSSPPGLTAAAAGLPGYAAAAPPTAASPAAQQAQAGEARTQ